MGHSTFRPLDNPQDRHVYLELLDETNINVLHTLGVYPMRNQFSQYPLCNIYRLWQPDELHQLLLGLVKDSLHWLLEYLKARTVKDQFDNRSTSVPRYPGLQRFSKPFNLMKICSWQGYEIRVIIRTLAVNCAPILDGSLDARKTAADTDSDEMVMGAVWALSEFSLLVSRQDHSDLSLAALDDAPKRFHKKKGAFGDQKMSKSANARVDEVLETESHHLRVQKIRRIHAAMEVQLYEAEKVTTSKRRQCQVHRNRARQATTIWSDTDWQRAIERLEPEIHQVTPAKHKLLDKLVQHHERQLLQEVRTKATGPRSIIAKKLARLTTAAEDEAYRAVNMTTDKRVQFQVCLSDAEIEATTWSITETDHVVNQVERDIYGITSKDQMWLTTEFSIRSVKFAALWHVISVQELRKTIEHRVIHFRYPKMHLVSHKSESIGRIGSGDNFTTDITERLHIGNVNEAY